MFPAYVWVLSLLVILLGLLFAFPTFNPVAPSPPLPLPSLPQKESSGPSHVKELLTNEDAEAFIEEGGILMVYAPWCGHCKTMMPAFEIASTQTKVKFARLEGQKAPAFMAKHEIRGFPTILSIKDKVVSRYNSGRDAASLLSHAAAL